MGKTLVYIVLLGILGFGVYYFLVRDNESLYQESEANFTFRDTSSIGKIFLVDNEGHSILLERNKDNRWTLNKQYPAMPLQIVNILTCLKMQTALKPVSELEHDRVVKLLAGLSTKVEVYDLKGAKIRSFYVAGQGPNYHGSYMIIENARQPYLVEVPGFDGYLTPRYTTDLNDWRSRAQIELPADSIASISLQYSNQPLNSFLLKNIKGGLEMIVDPGVKSKFPQFNTKRAIAYLDFFKLVNAEGYLNGSEGLDTLISNAPLRCKLDIVKTNGQTIDLDLYWVDKTDEALHSEENTATQKDNPSKVDRMYAVNHGTHDTLLVQMRSFEKLLRSSTDFYQSAQ
jgi:hypothetical protein